MGSFYRGEKDIALSEIYGRYLKLVKYTHMKLRKQRNAMF